MYTVCSWTAAGASQTRRYDYQLQGSSTKKVRRTEKVNNDGMAKTMILGAMQLGVECQHHLGHSLSTFQRKQYRNYLSQGLASTDLWHITVLRFFNLPNPVPLIVADPQARGALTGHMLPSDRHPLEILSFASDFEDDGPDLPGWVDDGLRMVLILSAEVLGDVVSGGERNLLIPALVGGHKLAPTARFQSSLDPHMPDILARAAQTKFLADAGWEADDMFTLAQTQEVADLLRSVLDFHQDWIPRLAPWITRLQLSADACTIMTDSGKRSWGDIIQLLIITRSLNDAGSLHGLILKVYRFLFPEHLRSIVAMPVQNMLEESSYKRFSKSQISHFRLSLDVSLMLFMRCRNRDASDRGKTCSRTMTWDSSPQFDRDYEMVLIQEIYHEDLPDVFESFHNIVNMWDFDEDFDAHLWHDPAQMQREADIMDSVHTCILKYVLPTVQIGFGAASFAHKLSALLHCIRLQTFTSKDCAEFSDSFDFIMSDEGTEAQLRYMLHGQNLKPFIPFFTDTDEVTIQDMLNKFNHIDGEDAPAGDPPPPAAAEILSAYDDAVFEDAPVDAASMIDDSVFEDVPPHVFDDQAPCHAEVFEDAGNPVEDNIEVSAAGSLDTPALHHLLHNASEGLRNAMPHYDDEVGKGQKVAKLVRKTASQKKLLERCFNTILGRARQDTIRRFRGNVYPARWATVAFSVAEMAKIHIRLSSHWDEGLYTQGNVEGQQKDTAEFIKACGEAICSVFFWAYWIVLESLSSF